jgi:hypothetical protein
MCVPLVLPAGARHQTKRRSKLRQLQDPGRSMSQQDVGATVLKSPSSSSKEKDPLLPVATHAGSGSHHNAGGAFADAASSHYRKVVVGGGGATGLSMGVSDAAPYAYDAGDAVNSSSSSKYDTSLGRRGDKGNV